MYLDSGNIRHWKDFLKHVASRLAPQVKAGLSRQTLGLQQ